MVNRRTRKRIKGGNPVENKFREYASKIANKEPVSIEDFTQFLNSIKDPLKVLIDYDKTGNPYTINEYALIHNAPYDIHAVFWNYEVALNHLIIYSNFGIREPINILEAYIIHSEYSENIRCIIENLNDSNQHFLFRQTPRTQGVPSVLYFTLESSNYIKKPLASYNYNMVVQLYLQTKNYIILTKTYSQLALINIAIRFNKPDLLQGICMKISNSSDIYKYLFHGSSVSFLLLQNNASLFDVAFDLLRIIDQTELFKYINLYDSSNDISQIIEKYAKRKTSPTVNDAKRFFELLGRHTMAGILEPYTGSKVRIIIRCHGVLKDEAKQQFDFPFGRLCYFISKGQTLCEAGYVSNRTENMICNGNYDENLQCIESVNGRVETEPMHFIFDSGFFLGTRNRYTGIYICREGIVERADELDIQEDDIYSMEKIVELCNIVCNKREIDPANVDILLFSCRSKLGTTSEIARVNPKLVAEI